MKPTIHVWCKKMLGGQEFTSDTGCNQLFITGLDSSIGDSEPCLNELKQYVGK